MQTYYVIVNKSGGYEFVERPNDTFGAPSTYVVNGDAEIYVYWSGRKESELVNAHSLVIPVHTMLMDVALGRKAANSV